MARFCYQIYYVQLHLLCALSFLFHPNAAQVRSTSAASATEQVQANVTILNHPTQLAGSTSAFLPPVDTTSVCQPCTLSIKPSLMAEVNSTLDSIVAKIQSVSAIYIEIHNLEFNESKLGETEVFCPGIWALSRSTSDVL